MPKYLALQIWKNMLEYDVVTLKFPQFKDEIDYWISIFEENDGLPLSVTQEV